VSKSFFVGLGLSIFGFVALNFIAYFLDRSPVYRAPSPDLISSGRPLAEFQFARPNSDSHSIKFNHMGFRDKERKKEAKPGVFRLAVLGDSMVEAKEVSESETAVRIFEKLMNEHYGRHAKIEVMNFGVGGYGYQQFAKLLSSVVLEFKPDYILLVSYGNDFMDDLRYEAFRENMQGVLGSILVCSFNKTIYEVFPLYRLVYLSAFKGVLNRATEQSATAANYDRLFRCAAEGGELIECSPGTFNALTSISKVLKSHSIPWGVISIPLTAEIMPKHLIELKKSEPGWDWNEFVLNSERLESLRTYFQKELAQREIAYLDLSLRIADIPFPDREKLYLRTDEHFNGNGQAFLGNEIFDWFVKQYGDGLKR